MITIVEINMAAMATRFTSFMVTAIATPAAGGCSKSSITIKNMTIPTTAGYPSEGGRGTRRNAAPHIRAMM